MEKVQVVFSRNWREPFSYAVRGVTWSSWSHCALMTPEGEVIESRFMPFPHGGVKETTFDDFRTRATTWEIREFEVKDAGAIIAAARSQIDKPYDTLALAGIFFHQGSWQEDNAWFCSELVAYAFDAGGSPLFNPVFDGRIVPQNVYMAYSVFVQGGNN